MSDPERFLARWSRRKRAAGEDDNQTQSPTPPAGAAPTTGAAEDDRAFGDAAAAASGPVTAEPAFDITRLPPLDSITATTDIRAFLAPGVPPELSRAALRRAWSADPNIRDFVGLADYDWDYHAPGSMGGFGPLEMTEELRQFAARIVGGDPPAAEAPARDALPAAAPSPQTAIKTDNQGGRTVEAAADHAVTRGSAGLADPQAASVTGPVALAGADAALQHKTDETGDERMKIARPHGRALPK